MTFLAFCMGFADRSALHALCEDMLVSQQAPVLRERWQEGAVAIAAAAEPRLSGGDTSVLRPTACGRWLLAIDARLDDRATLAATLGVGRADAVSSVALLTAAWQRWGADAVERIHGDFAIAAWDRHEESLVLARDPLGQRPLFFRAMSAGYAVASMPAGLALGEPLRPNSERLIAHLNHRLYLGERSFHAGIERVCPGQVVRLSFARTVVRTRYWRPRVDPDAGLSTHAAAEQLAFLLDRACADRLTDAGPTVAAHLSAGLDSSAVAAFAARHHAGVLGVTAIPDPMLAHTSPSGRIADEAGLAGRTARFVGIAHDTVSASHGYAGLLDTAFERLAQPMPNPFNFGWTSAILSRLAKQDVPMLLTGQSGNLSFSVGASRGLSRLVRAGQWIDLARELVGGSIRPRLETLLRRTRRARSLPASAVDWTLLRPEHVQPFEPATDQTEQGIAMLQAMDPGAMLRGFFTGWGVDMRDPTADRRLLEFALRIPESARYMRGMNRAPARLALRGVVPETVRRERRRGYQAADWLDRSTRDLPLIRRELDALAGSAFARSLIDIPRAQSLLERWPGSMRYDPDTERLYRHVLPQAIAVGGWARRAVGE